MTTNTLLAFHSDKKLKAAMLREVRKHEKADQIISGTYGDTRGKKWVGCAVGCSIRSLAIAKGKTLATSDHALFEAEAGVPLMLARLQDTLFEGLPPEKRAAFPREFWSAIRPGADLSRVGWQFLHWLLTEELAGRDHPTVRDAVKQCADVLVPLTKGEAAAESAASSAESAASSAESAASSAESAAWAARSAASSAESAAWAAESAASSAESAAWAAESAASSAESAACSAAYYRMARKLVALLKAA